VLDEADDYVAEFCRFFKVHNMANTFDHDATCIWNSRFDRARVGMDVSMRRL